MLRFDTSSPADQGAMLPLLLALVDADSLLGCGASLVDRLGTLIFCTTTVAQPQQQTQPAKHAGQDLGTCLQTSTWPSDSTGTH